MPQRSDIDPVEIPRLLPIALLADIAGSGPRMRILGSEATAAYGAETRGQRAGDLRLGGFSQAWTEALSLAVDGGAPVAAAGHFDRDGQWLEAQALLTPLGDARGEITHLFGGLTLTFQPACRRLETPRAHTLVRPAADLAGASMARPESRILRG